MGITLLADLGKDPKFGAESEKQQFFGHWKTKFSKNCQKGKIWTFFYNTFLNLGQNGDFYPSKDPVS